MDDSTAVDTWRASLTADLLPAVDALRAAVEAASPALRESIKWNAPSFALAGEDRVTLNLGPKGTLRLVLHRGARTPMPPGFAFDDPDGLARWAAPDRGIVTFHDHVDVAAKAAAVTRLVRRWIEA